jgi:hypothetical protein
MFASSGVPKGTEGVANAHRPVVPGAVCGLRTTTLSALSGTEKGQFWDSRSDTWILIRP